MFFPAALISQPAPITHHQVKAHPMRYYLALPEGWTADRTWPVVVVVPDAHRDFEANLRRFVAARGSRPYLLVAPEVPTCGGARDETSPPYSYSAQEWEAIKTTGEYAFDDAGLAALLQEVHDRWGGYQWAFLTGWEAGGHTVWAQALRRPERWFAVAPVSPNYQGRGLSEGVFSTAPARLSLPIRVFWCGAPTGAPAQAMGFLRSQTAAAVKSAQDHGFAAVGETTVAGADHGPLPEAVLAWFDRLLAANHPDQ